MTNRAKSDTETVDQQVRLHVFHQAAETGHVPKPDEIAVGLGRPQLEVEESLYRPAVLAALTAGSRVVPDRRTCWPELVVCWVQPPTAARSRHPGTPQMRDQVPGSEE